MNNPLDKVVSESEKLRSRTKSHKATEEMAQRLAHFKAKSEQAEATLAKYRKEKGGYRALVEELKTAIVAADRWERVPYDPGDRKKSPVTMVVQASDWHIGEVVDREETEGFGEYNWAIAKRRINHLSDSLIASVGMHRAAGFPIDEIAIFSTGDLVSGDIHQELSVTNEFPVTVATANAGMLLGEFALKLAAHFKHVNLYEISADNHGRLTRKNQAKQGGKNNFSYLAHTICNQYVSKEPRIVPTVFPGTKGMASVQGKRFLLSHGHHIMGQMGIPFYGLERDRAREAVKRMKVQPFDYLATSHFHTACIIGGVILMNGSLSGTNEYDHLQGRTGGAAQTSYLVHPKYGYFNWTPWRLD